MNAMDISYCQNTPDFAILKDRGIEYVIIKATQQDYVDPKFTKHIKRAIEDRMPIGVYHFLTASSRADAVSEAKCLLTAIEPYKKYIGRVFVDVETYDVSGASTSFRERMAEMRNIGKGLTDVVNAFVNYVNNHGYICGVYTNIDHLNTVLDINHPLWLANWSVHDPCLANEIIWQCGLDVIEGQNVDADIHKLSKGELAIYSLCYKGFIESPAYWIRRLSTVKYLEQLFINADKTYKSRWKESIILDWALLKTRRDGVTNNPLYWKEQTKSVKYLKELLLKFGGGQK